MSYAAYFSEEQVNVLTSQYRALFGGAPLDMSPAAEVRRKREHMQRQHRELGRKARETLQTMAELARALVADKQYEEAVRVGQECVSLLQQKGQEGDSKEVLAVLTSVAANLSNNDEDAEAVRFGRGLLTLQERVLGERQSLTLLTMHNLSLGLFRCSRLAEAKLLMRRCLALRREVLGAEHEDTLASMHNMTCILVTFGETKEAFRMGLECLELQLRVNHGKHTSRSVSTMTEVVKLGPQVEENAEAIRLGPSCVELRRLMLGTGENDTCDTVAAMLSVSTAHFSCGNNEEAVRWGREGLELSERVLGPVHFNTLRCLSGMLLWSCRAGCLEETVRLGRQSLELRELATDQGPGAIVMNMYYYALALFHSGDFEESSRVMQEGLSLQVRLWGEFHQQTMVMKVFLSLILHCTGELAESVRVGLSLRLPPDQTEDFPKQVELHINATCCACLSMCLIPGRKQEALSVIDTCCFYAYGPQVSSMLSLASLRKLDTVNALVLLRAGEVEDAVRIAGDAAKKDDPLAWDFEEVLDFPFRMAVLSEILVAGGRPRSGLRVGRQVLDLMEQIPGQHWYKEPLRKAMERAQLMMEVDWAPAVPLLDSTCVELGSPVKCGHEGAHEGFFGAFPCTIMVLPLRADQQHMEQMSYFIQSRNTVNSPRLLHCLGVVELQQSCCVVVERVRCPLLDELHKRSAELQRGEAVPQQVRWAIDAVAAVRQLRDSHVEFEEIQSRSFFLLHHGKELVLSNFGLLDTLHLQSQENSSSPPLVPSAWTPPELLQEEACSPCPLEDLEDQRPLHVLLDGSSDRRVFADSYALGVVLWEIATGLEPYAWLPSTDSMVKEVLEARPTGRLSFLQHRSAQHQHPLLQHHPCDHMPSLYVDLIHSCLRYDPESRPRLKDLLQDLRSKDAKRPRKAP